MKITLIFIDYIKDLKDSIQPKGQNSEEQQMQKQIFANTKLLFEYIL